MSFTVIFFRPAALSLPEARPTVIDRAVRRPLREASTSRELKRHASEQPTVTSSPFRITRRRL